jgi:hypothetical protein
MMCINANVILRAALEAAAQDLDPVLTVFAKTKTVPQDDKWLCDEARQ